MSNLSLRRPMPHGKNDIGWRTSIPNQGEHWFMSTKIANVAISHCGQVFHTKLLTVVQDAPHCTICVIIESMRDALDCK